MTKIAIIFLAFILSACDPYWSVRREADMSVSEIGCIRNAIRNTEGVLGVIELNVSQSYTLTGKKIPKPVVFEFETELENGFVHYENGRVEVYFGGIGMTKPPKNIEELGPKYLEAVLNSIVLNCKVSGQAANKALLPTAYVAGAPPAAAEFNRYASYSRWRIIESRACYGRPR